MRLIEEGDVDRINAYIVSKKWKNSAKESYFKKVENSDSDLTEINYKSLPELTTEFLKIKDDIDNKFLKSILIASIKARAKYDLILDENLYEYAELHKNDIQTIIYAF